MILDKIGGCFRVFKVLFKLFIKLLKNFNVLCCFRRLIGLFYNLWRKMINIVKLDL